VPSQCKYIAKLQCWYLKDDTNIFGASLVMCLRCGGIFHNQFIAFYFYFCSMSQPVKEYQKSANTWPSYDKNWWFTFWTSQSSL